MLSSSVIGGKCRHRSISGLCPRIWLLHVSSEMLMLTKREDGGIAVPSLDSRCMWRYPGKGDKRGEEFCIRQRFQSEPIVLVGFDVFSASAFPHLVGRTWTEEWTVRWSRSWTPCRSPPPRSEPGPAQGRGWRNLKFRSTRGWNLQVEEWGWLNWEVTFTYFQTSFFFF